MELLQESTKHQTCENGLSKAFQTQFITSRQLVFTVTMAARLLVFKVIVELGREGWGSCKSQDIRLSLFTEI